MSRKAQNGEKRAPRVQVYNLILMEMGKDGIGDKVIKVFPNRYRLAKWFNVAKDIDVTLPERCYVLRARAIPLAEALTPKARKVVS